METASNGCARAAVLAAALLVSSFFSGCSQNMIEVIDPIYKVIGIPRPQPAAWTAPANEDDWQIVGNMCGSTGDVNYSGCVCYQRNLRRRM